LVATTRTKSTVAAPNAQKTQPQNSVRVMAAAKSDASVCSNERRGVVSAAGGAQLRLDPLP
jgi:hypothetical protein